MITIIQRVTQAQVSVNKKTIGTINQGIMALIAIEKHDSEKTAQRLLQRILNYRIFADNNDRMNFNLQNIQGGLLLIPQFTLVANTQSGNRPSFKTAASPELATTLFNYFIDYAKTQYSIIETGQFGANMQVSLINDGPVTFTLNV